jgi:hypothetical protein
MNLSDELDGALAGKEVMMGDAADGNHSETAVLDLLNLWIGKINPQLKQDKGKGGSMMQMKTNLVVGESLRVLLQAKRVETKIAGAVDGAITELEEERDLKEANEPENLGQTAFRTSKNET